MSRYGMVNRPTLTRARESRQGVASCPMGSFRSAPSLQFDDRLATVLSQPVRSTHDRAVRWRQLVDLVASSAGEGDRVLLEQAITVIRFDAVNISEPVRAAAARSIAGKPIPLTLLRIFAADKLSVAAPLFTSIRLTGQALASVRVVASPDVAAMLDRLFPAENAPSASAGVEAPMSSGADQLEQLNEKSAELPRHAERRDSEGSVARPLESPPESGVDLSANIGSLPSPKRVNVSDYDDLPPPLFRWESNPQGEIDWVEGAPRGALIGRSLVDTADGGAIAEQLEQALDARSPFRDCPINLGDVGAVRGSWTLGGAPVFNSSDGRFIGFRGIARRVTPELADSHSSAQTDRPVGHDALRELIHEIKTPLNAIIGFAEIIDGQYFGPAHRQYRERAAQIVGNARLLLQASDDLDFVARHQSGRFDSPAPVRVADFAFSVADHLTSLAQSRGIVLQIANNEAASANSRIDGGLAQRLIDRFAETMLKAATDGERLAGRLVATDPDLALSIDKPLALMGVENGQLLNAEYAVRQDDPSGLGFGFNLRLVNGLASLAGCRLEIGDRSISLILPLVKT